MSDQTRTLDDVMKKIDEQFDGSVERLSDLLRLESVSTDPAHDKQTADCAEFCAEMLRSIGFEAEAVVTSGHPMVVAEHQWLAAPPQGEATVNR